MALSGNQPNTTAPAQSGNDSQTRTLLQSYEDGAIQAIEDAETAARNGDPALQQTIMMSAIAYATAAVMLQNKLKGGY